MKKFNQARVNGGSNYDSKSYRERVMRAALLATASGIVGSAPGHDTVKLRRPPKAHCYQACPEMGGVAGVMTSGMVTT